MNDVKAVNDKDISKIYDDIQQDEISSEKEKQNEEQKNDKNLVKDDMYYYGLFEAILFLSNEPVPISFFVKNFNIRE